MVVDPNALPALWSSPGQWCQSSFLGGSPGTDDPEPVALRITEIHYHPEDPSTAEELAGFHIHGLENAQPENSVLSS